MIDDKKTLGQIDVDEIAAKYAEILFMHGHTDRVMNMAVYRKFIPIGIEIMQTVCRAVMDEREPPKPEAASKAGDWAMEAFRQIGESMSRDSAVAKIREAAERHYGEKIMDLQMKLIEANNKLLEKVRTPSQLEHARRLADRLDAIEKERDAARAECERLLEKLNTAEANLQEYRELVPTPSPAAAATGDDELRKAIGNADVSIGQFSTGQVVAAIRPLFAAVRRERDEAINAVECHKSYHNTEQAIKRAEAAEADLDKIAAELAELKAACNWANETWVTKVSNSVADDIIAAYRATKGKEPTDAK